MALTREKRSTAGNRLARLLDAEDEDEFYKTTYGGFEEEEEDHDYSSEGSGTDEVDSDFDIDENDELKSDHEDDEPKRKRRVVTKAYKEPTKKKPADTDTTKHKKEKEKRRKKAKEQISTDNSTIEPIGKKALRRSTAQKSADQERKRVEKEERMKKLKQEIAARRNVAEVRRLTQKELLEEAKHTEVINLRSLEMYQKLELERKRVRTVKRQQTGPMIRYQSTSMPIIEEVTDVNIEDETEEIRRVITDKCARTFITFTDPQTFDDTFPDTPPPRVPARQYCVVTRQPARYFDPVTRLPYANAKAFKILREAYHQVKQASRKAHTLAYNEDMLILNV